MATKKGLADYKIPYNGTDTAKFDVEGDFFHVQSVDVGGVSVFLRFDEGKLITRQQGEGNRVYYSRVEVSASAACNIVLQLGNGYATDARANVSATISTTDAPALHTPSLPAVALPNGGAATLIAAADANSLGIMIGLASTAANGVWIGDNTVALNNGLFIEPGQIMPWPSAAAVYGSNNGAAPITVSCVKFSEV